MTLWGEHEWLHIQRMEQWYTTVITLLATEYDIKCTNTCTIHIGTVSQAIVQWSRNVTQMVYMDMMHTGSTSWSAGHLGHDVAEMIWHGALLLSFLTCTSLIAWLQQGNSFPGHVGRERMTMSQLLVHTWPFQEYFHNIVSLTWSVHVDYICTKNSKYSLCTRTCRLSKWLQSFSVESVIQKCYPSIPLLCSVMWKIPSHPSKYFSCQLNTVTAYQHNKLPLPCRRCGEDWTVTQGP